MRHFGLEMSHKLWTWHLFYFLVFVDVTLSFYVNTYALTGSSENGIDSWNRGIPRLELTDGEDVKGPTQQPLKDTDEYEKWFKVLTYDKSYNLSETDRGPGNESKVIVISEEDHLDVYEDDEDKEERTRLQENIFQLLNSESLLSQLTAGERSKDLRRFTRQAEPQKRRCKCRRLVRRNRGRRRLRRRRNGQQSRQRRGRRRRTGRRRGRRRCVCRKGDGEEGKSDGETGEEDGEGEEVEGEDEDGGEEVGEDGSEEGGDNGSEEDGESSEEDGSEEGESDEGSDEGGDEESSEEEGGEKSPPNTEGGQSVSPGNTISIPPGSVIMLPGQPSMPYPNMMPSYPGKIPYFNTIPSYPAKIPYPDAMYIPNSMPIASGIPVGKK